MSNWKNHAVVVYMRNRKVFLVYTILIFITIFYMITFPSYRFMDKLYKKTDELNKLYENWLHMRAEVTLYLSSEKKEKDKNRFIDSVTVFDISFEYLIDEDIYQIIEKKEPDMRDSRMLLVQSWQNIQFELVKIIQEEGSIESFAEHVSGFMNDTERFEKNLKKIIQKANNYRKNGYRLNLFILYFFSIVVLFLYTVTIIEYFQTEKAKRSEKEIRKLSETLISVRENERKRIALDIHDTLVQKLGKIKTDLVKINDCRVIEEEIVETIAIARSISYNLRPIEIREEFFSSLDHYLTDLSFQYNFKISKTIIGFGKIKLKEEFQINLFRIVQEIFQNIIKHSGADKVKFKLIFSYPYILLTVSDNGAGFDYYPLKWKKDKLSSEHMGITGIYERVRLFAGEVKIKSNKGEGTLVKIKLPYRGFK